MTLDKPLLPVLFASTLALGSCLNLDREPPEKSYYLIEVSRETPDPGSGTEILQVRRFQAASAYAGRSFVYRTSDTEIETDFYHEFHVPPGVAISEAAREWLAGSGLFRHVQAPGDSSIPTLVLEGNLRAMYGDYRNSPAEAVLDLDITLVSPKRSEPVFRAIYSSRIPVEDGTPVQLVEGWNKGLTQILGELERDLSSVSSES